MMPRVLGVQAFPPKSLRTIMLLVAALSLACGDPLAPADVAGTYVLKTVAGDPLPALLYITDFASVRVVADTLRLNADGRGSVITVRQSDYPTEPTAHPERFKWAFSFRIVDDRIEVALDCPINADCIAPPHIMARRIPYGLRVEKALGARVPQIYMRN